MAVRNGRGRLFGMGLGIGVVLGFALGTVLVARLGEEAVAVARSVIERLLGREEGVRFEALLQ